LSLDQELKDLARERENASHASLPQIMVEQPSTLLRQLRHYLAEMTNYGYLKRTYELPRLATVEGGLQELVCEEIEFHSDSRLSFSIQLEQEQSGWLVKRFKFHLLLAQRNVNMVRIHLNQTEGHDPLNVPRCHFHVGDSTAHIPFPIMNPRLMLHLLCEQIEPDFGLQRS
jgi:hypothetical protein